MMLKLVGTLIAFAFVGTGFGGFAGQNPPPAPPKPTIPAEAINTPNPVKINADLVEHAKKIYAVDCALCHGDDGAGKTDLAKSLGYTMVDYTNPDTLKDKKDGELFWKIKNGYGNMPAEGTRAKTDDEWALVIYLRSFSDPSILPASKK
jgi:mono/diheme cytochrome c family protein